MVRQEQAGPKSARPGVAELNLARIVRFYHVDPLRLPVWFLDVLQRSISPLQAEEIVRGATMGRLAGAKQGDFERFIRRLNDMAEPYTPTPIPPLVKPDHAAWFEREGIPHRVH